ncbi:MAG TPA: DUF1273 domain-containing protein, partial [Candidatus Tetragenococcus pullicola]|nr:DUF1273 domain-containing protein [Candidatus Tetragenococcus pullicola]
KIQIVKKVIKMSLKTYLEEGLEWVIIGGNLGVEIWAGQISIELKKEYPELRLGIIQPFHEMEKNWNEGNRQLLNELKVQADFVDSVSHKPYENPSQLKNHTLFLIQHTDGALLVYDDEYPGKTRYFLQEATQKASKNQYFLQFITMDDLQNAVFEDTV